MKKPKPPEYYLKVRTYQEPSPHVGLWLCRRDHLPGQQGILFGEVLPALADEVIAGLGLPVEREAAPYAIDPLDNHKGCRALHQQRTLFGG